MSEIQLQAACFQWFWNTYPDERGLLYMNYNNAKNQSHGAILKAIGMVAGVADLTLLTKNGAMFIELKTEVGKQSPTQKQWEAKVREYGYQYHVVRTLEEFKSLVNQR
jgi:hypothetical protein